MSSSSSSSSSSRGTGGSTNRPQQRSSNNDNTGSQNVGVASCNCRPPFAHHGDPHPAAGAPINPPSSSSTQRDVVDEAIINKSHESTVHASDINLCTAADADVFMSNSTDELQIDNSVMVREKIARLYAERLLCDITLNVGGSSFPAHRLILCASSEVFQVMLMNPNWSESQETTVILQEDPPCVRVFADFLKYLYTGKIHINHNSVLPLLTLADKYNVEDLVQLCLAYMQSHLVSAFAHGQLIAWLQYTVFCGHEAVAFSCQDFIRWNFKAVADGRDFGNLDVDVLISFLLSSELVIHHEMALFQCVTRWLTLQEQKHSASLAQQSTTDNSTTIMSNEWEWEQRFAALVFDVMSNVRFPMMTPHQLAELLLSPLVSRYNGFFVEKMGDAMSFHSSDGSAASRLTRLTRTPEGRLHLTPRLYTAEKWGTPLSIEDFDTFPRNGVRTLVFSSPAGLSEPESKRMLEWSVDLYPRGVRFKKFYLIAWHGTMEVSESEIRSVRLSILSRTSQDCRIRVGILLYSCRDGVEHVGGVLQKTFVFSADERILNIDHLVNFDELNSVPRAGSSHLVGSERDTFKVHVILTPLDNWK